jgi:hypothetical protein
MNTSSSRTMVARGRGDRIDRAPLPNPVLVDDRAVAGQAGARVSGQPRSDGRTHHAKRRPAQAGVPDWLSAEDLLAPRMRLVHGEPI